MRAYCAAKYESFVRDAALADSMRAMRSHLEPLRVLPEKCLPADSLFPGHIAAHDANRPALDLRLEQGVDRLPVNAGRLHSHECDGVAHQPIVELEQVARCR